MVNSMAREMKDSGIEWIGVIPKDWEIRKLSDMASRITDFVASGSFASLKENVTYLDEPNYAMLIRTADISGRSNLSHIYIDEITYSFLKNSNLFGGELILPNIGSVGDVYIYEPIYKHASLAPNSILVDMKDSNRFYYYWLLNPVVNNALKNIGSDSVQAKFNKTQLRQFRVVRPSIIEQQKIAYFLDQKVSHIDNILEKTKQSIEEYKKYKQGLITEVVTKGLDKNVKMKDSGIEWNRKIPIHWNTIASRRVFCERKGKAQFGLRQLTSSQKHGILYQEDFMQMENQKVVLVDKDFSILKQVEPNDFVISMRSFQGGLEYSTLKGCISSAYVMIIPGKEVYPPFYKWLFKSAKYINALQSTSNLIRDGQALRFSNFAQIPLFIIPLEEQREIAEYLDKKTLEIDNLIETKKFLLNELENYKKSVIYEYVTGKREVI